jgi:SAM-dependent methyltransferase
MPKPPIDSSFTANVAEFYESTLVPLIFRPYADDLASRTTELRPTSVLEVACGTGVVTRALATSLPDDCSIVATDLNQAMVEHGRSVGTDRPVTWRQADVMALPYPDAMFNVWNGIEHNEFADVVTHAVGTLYPDDPPVFLVRTPHGHGSPTEIDADVRSAGFERCLLVQRDETSRAATAELPAIAYCHGAPLRNEICEREQGGLDRATAVAADALRSRFGSEDLEGRISAVIVVAR